MRHLSVFYFPLRLLAFWLLFFAVFRLWFILWFHDRWAEGASGRHWAAFWRALPLDLSMAGYLMALPLLVWLIGLLLNYPGRRLAERLVKGYNVLIFGILIFVFGANIFLYEEWHTPINNRALEYFRTPAAMLDSMSLMFKIGSVAAYLAFTWLWWRLYRVIVELQLYRPGMLRWQALWSPVLLGSVMLAIRGGLGVMPINESAVYYSPHLFDNHAATNTAWHLVHSLVETRSTEHHYRFLDDKIAWQRTQNLYASSNKKYFDNPPPPLLAAPGRPNVVFLILESMTAQVIEELGGEPGVCPNLSGLIREGILFDSIYSSGYRTDQGLVAILAGYPSQPDQSIVLLDDKAATLPSIPKILRDSGYQTLYVYGGELTFANIGVWLTHQRFDRILSEKDFPSEAKTQRWGVDDLTMLQRSVLEINQLQPPFFASLMTLSLHPPYDVPYKSRWQGETIPQQFIHSAAFADHAIGAFFEAARQQPWYPNTLFVLVADHGNSMPGNLGMDQPQSRHVPLIVCGPALDPRWHGARVSVLGNHHDIPATVLPGLGFSQATCAEFQWSKDLLARSGDDLQQGKGNFAYYTNENGLGWLDGRGAGFYRFQDREWQFYGEKPDSTSLIDAKAYLQALYEDFLQR